MISFVNGYMCSSCCDVAKAERGENPHPKDDPSKPGYDPAHVKKAAGDRNTEGPAVVFGGALAQLMATNGVTAKGAITAAGASSQAVSSQAAPASSVDILA